MPDPTQIGKRFFDNPAHLGHNPGPMITPSRGAKPKPSQFHAQHLAAILRRPPEVKPVYHAYNQLRQLYILEQTCRHFGCRPDDPAPLYGKSLLDVGCGESNIAEFLALSGADITAIDPDPAVLAKAQASAEAFGAPVTFMKSKAESFIGQPFKFNVILALDVLEEAPDADKLIWVLRQLLAPGGVLILSAINRSFFAWFLHIVLSSRVYGRTPRGRRQWKRFYAPEGSAGKAKKQGPGGGNLQMPRFSLTDQQWVATGSGGTRYLMALHLADDAAG